MITKTASDMLYNFTFKGVCKSIKEIWDFDLSYMEVHATSDKDKLPGKWTPDKEVYIGTIQALNEYLKDYDLLMDAPDLAAHMIKHELGHEVYENHLTQEEREMYDDKLENFTTRYIMKVEPEREPIELFAEYFATSIF